MVAGVDPELLHAWVAARSIARALPPPVADFGGWRVDVGSASEICRWIYAAAFPGIGEIALTYGAPGYQIKVCGSVETLAGFVPADWTVEATGWFMIGGTMLEADPLPGGYTVQFERNGAQTEMRIAAPDGSLAATGYAGETAGGFAYDRIVTEPEHRRRGLGRAIMTGLQAQKRDPSSPDLLVATEMGRALYESLGWRALSPYSTAYSPGKLA